ncbi:MAG: glycogen/starch/alpha-glucan phosphorylase, partial [Clostridia bacterium]|nr:glycogen/starch/alpha-glucan phosphorylase [Clostridia bacterium]
MTQHFYTQFDKAEFKAEVKHNLTILYGKKLEDATPTQIYAAVSNAVKEMVIERWMHTIKNCYDNGTKQVYYMSMEFLMGRFLGNNLINLGIMDGVKEALDEMGISLDTVEDAEPDPGLGNGGLGRLAACFLDSLTTLDMPAVGCGIRYKNGIFKQLINNRGEQEERPDDWLIGGTTPWEIIRPEWSFEIKFGGTVRYVPKGNDSYDFVQENYSSVMAVAHDIPITGYGTDTVNTLRLWDAEAVHKFDIAEFNAGNYRKAVEQDYLAKTIVEVLYPADDHISGKELRLKQQYFFVSATIQQAIKEFKMLGNTDFSTFSDKYAFQLNDTHPS